MDNAGGAVHEEDEGAADLNISGVEKQNGEVVVIDDREVRGDNEDEVGWDLKDLKLPADA